jgi:hypothetical protein
LEPTTALSDSSITASFNIFWCHRTERIPFKYIFWITDITSPDIFKCWTEHKEAGSSESDILFAVKCLPFCTFDYSMPYNEAVLGQEDSSVKITSIKASFYFDSQLSLSLRLKYSVQLAQHIQSPLIKHIRKRFQIPDPISDPAASEVIFRKETDIMCPDSSNISMNLDVLSKFKQLYYSVLTECHSAAPLAHLTALTPQFTPPSATEGNLYIATLPYP